MAAFAPMPMARVKAAITANPGLRCKTRQPYWTSSQNVSMATPLLACGKKGLFLLIDYSLSTKLLPYLPRWANSAELAHSENRLPETHLGARRHVARRTALPRSAQMHPRESGMTARQIRHCRRPTFCVTPD